MAPKSKRCKSCSRNEDRISRLPDTILCHIVSFFSTREAVKTSVLSHRWKNVWASVSNLDLDEEEYRLDYVCRTMPRLLRLNDYDPDRFAQFVNRVLLFRCQGNIHRFRLVTKEMDDVSLIYAWISTAIRRSVVELDITVGTPTAPHFLHFEIPRSLFLCSTLMSLKLWLRRDISAITPSSNCFPCLKFLHVTVSYPDSDSMEKLFSCFPVLEDLIIDGELQDASAFNLDISAPKLKRLQIRFKVHKFAMRSGANNFVNYMCQLFINADAPNLEEIDICYDFLVSYSLKNAKCLSKATIDFLDVRVLKVLDCFVGLSDRIRQLFAGICDAKFLTVSAPIFVALGIGNQLLLPTLNNLNHSELQLQTCHCLQSLTTLLKISPNLEHLKISPNSKHLVFYNYKYCDDDNEDELGDWGTPEFVPICLISHLKTICLWDFNWCPHEMVVLKYLVKHGKALNKVTIYTRFSGNKEMMIQSPFALWSKISKFSRGSKTCEIEFRTII